MTDQYILDEKGNPVPSSDLLLWGKWVQETNLRKVAVNTISSGVRISTVFLGLDHSFGEGEPVLFETMTFGLGDDDIQQRYTTREEAIAGHAQVVELVINMQQERSV